MTTHMQEEVLNRWFSNEAVDKMDVIPEGDGTVRAHMFESLDSDVYELVGIGIVTEDGEWTMFSPSPAQILTIRPEPAIEGEQPPELRTKAPRESSRGSL